MIHLTLTGFYAGQPICGSERKETDTGVHCVYAPLIKDEYRATVCPDCLKAYANSYDEEELPGAPDWVKELRNSPQGDTTAPTFD